MLLLAQGLELLTDHDWMPFYAFSMLTVGITVAKPSGKLLPTVT